MTTSRTLLKLNVVGQRSTSHGFLCVFVSTAFVLFVNSTLQIILMMMMSEKQKRSFPGILQVSKHC